MAKSVKTIIDAFCDRINQPRESSYVGASTPAARQYVSLFQYVGDMMRNMPYQWPQLKRNWLFLTQTNVRNYPYPGDFYRPLEGTQFDNSSQIPMMGPISDRNYAIRSAGIISLQTQKAYQILGKTSGIIHTRVNNEYNSQTDGYFRIDPPGPSEVDLLSMAYLSKNYVLPAAWVKSTSYTGTSSYVSVNGNIYSCERAGAHNSGTGLPPTVVGGIGTDGGTLWACIAFADPYGGGVWGSTTAYTAGQYMFTTGGKYYLCTTGGTSGSVEPTGITSAVTDGTVTWKYLSTSAWTANTQYSFGTYVTQSITIPGGASSTQLYMNVAINPFESVSGTNAPCWYWDSGYWHSIDGATLWTALQTYDTILADTDLCLFDSDIMIEGLRWAWYEAKKQDFSDLKVNWQNMLQSSYGRFEAPCAVNAGLGAESMYPWPNVPLGSWPGVGGT